MVMFERTWPFIFAIAIGTPIMFWIASWLANWLTERAQALIVFGLFSIVIIGVYIQFHVFIPWEMITIMARPGELMVLTLAVAVIGLALAIKTKFWDAYFFCLFWLIALGAVSSIFFNINPIDITIAYLHTPEGTLMTWAAGGMTIIFFELIILLV